MEKEIRYKQSLVVWNLSLVFNDKKLSNVVHGTEQNGKLFRTVTCDWKLPIKLLAVDIVILMC